MANVKQIKRHRCTQHGIDHQSALSRKVASGKNGKSNQLILRFGKNVGLPVDKVDKPYLIWLYYNVHRTKQPPVFDWIEKHVL